MNTRQSLLRGLNSIRKFARRTFKSKKQKPSTAPPPVHELEFLRLTKNHAEYSKNLNALGFSSTATSLKLHILHVAERWYRLGIEHLDDARSSLSQNRSRSTYSRSYYAVYNSSKSVRYICTGWVSLKGDDHQKTSDLPDDFPDVAKWSDAITKLYEHRLRADYDNWVSTGDEFSLTPTQCFALAEEFVAECAKYLNAKYGTRL